MIVSVLAKLDFYWVDVNVVMGVAAILDTRYKMKLLEFYYPNIYGKNFDLEIEVIKFFWDNYTLPTCGLPLIRCAYSWFQF